MSISALAYLSDDDKSEARRVGMARYQRALALDRTQPFGDPGDDQRSFIDCYSALAECAVANYLNLPWRKELVDDLTVKPADVGDRIEVRWTKYPTGCLIGHHTDAPGWIMVLVRGEIPEMLIEGWTTTGAVQQEKYQGNPKARSTSDYWFPARELLMMELLAQMRLGE